VPNLVARDFHAEKPNEKWLTDITEFSLPAGKVYLSPIIDCFDGLAVTWSIGTSPNAKLVNSMLDAAISQLRPEERPILHSDRGGHYRWPGWIRRMEEAGLTRSMSKKGCSPDNAACEGFFGRLKNEMFYGVSWEGCPCRSLSPYSTVTYTGITGSASKNLLAGAALWSSGTAWVWLADHFINYFGPTFCPHAPINNFNILFI
jgi:transposase InsO family protein